MKASRRNLANADAANAARQAGGVLLSKYARKRGIGVAKGDNPFLEEGYKQRLAEHFNKEAD